MPRFIAFYKKSETRWYRREFEADSLGHAHGLTISLITHHPFDPLRDEWEEYDYIDDSGLEEVREQHDEDEEYIPEPDEYEEDRLPEIEDEPEGSRAAPLVLNDADFDDDGEFEV